MIQKDAMVVYYETAEFIAYTSAYNAALEAEAHYWLLCEENDIDPYRYQVPQVAQEAKKALRASQNKAHRLLLLCRMTSEHKAAFGW